jgi:hypothetical protein
MARPKKTQEQRRPHVVSFRLTDAERAALEEVAARARVRFNELARKLTVAGGDRVVITTYKACDPAYLARLSAIGNNLNQLTRKAHVSGEISPRIAEVCDLIEEIITEATAGAFDQ